MVGAVKEGVKRLSDAPSGREARKKLSVRREKNHCLQRKKEVATLKSEKGGEGSSVAARGGKKRGED